jgi:hypothetical protein
MIDNKKIVNITTKWLIDNHINETKDLKEQINEYIKREVEENKKRQRFGNDYDDELDSNEGYSESEDDDDDNEDDDEEVVQYHVDNEYKDSWEKNKENFLEEQLKSSE